MIILELFGQFVIQCLVLSTLSVAFIMLNNVVLYNHRLSALHYAARESHKEVIQLLLERGADADLKTKHRYKKYT